MNKHISNEMIISAHHLRIELGMSYQEIFDACEEIGLHTPMSTIRRFFSEDATQHKFAASTVQGIIAVLGDTRHKTKGLTGPESVDFLKEIIAYKNMIIEELDAQVAAHEEEMQRLKEQYTTRTYEIVAENQNKIDFIKEQMSAFKQQIDIKDRRMDEREAFLVEQIRLKDRRYDELRDRYDRLLADYMALTRK